MNARDCPPQNVRGLGEFVQRDGVHTGSRSVLAPGDPIGHHEFVPVSGRSSAREQASNLGSWVVQYIGPPADSQHFVEAAREEGLEAQYSPLMSARRGEEIFEVGEVTVAGPDLWDRTARAMNRVLQRFPVGHLGFAAAPRSPARNSSQHEVDLHGFMRVLPYSTRLVLTVNDHSGETDTP